MPNISVCLPELKLIYVRYSGVIKRDEILEDFSRLQQDPDFDPTFPALNDMLDATSFLGGFSEIAAIIRNVGDGYLEQGMKLKIAICAPLDVPFGMSRIYESLADMNDTVDAGVFREFWEAAAFLGRPEKTREDMFARTNKRLPVFWTQPMPKLSD